MKSTRVVTLLSALVAAVAVAGPQKIVFQRGDNIWIANIDGTATKKIAIGSEPSISLTGTQVAFNTTPTSKYGSLGKGAPDPDTHIGVVDLGSAGVTTPPSLWLFDLVTQRATHLANPKELSVWGGCWLNKNNILFQSGGADESDRPAIYRMSLDGTDLKRLIRDGSSPSVSAP